MLYLYNSLTRRKEEFKPLNPPNVGFYTCGPTVYDYDHIGHAWNYTFADILRRVLEYNGYSVKHIMNITDVGHLVSDSDTGEDKLEKGARREGKTVWEIARYYTDIFLANREKMNMLAPAVICKATDHIPEMIALIKKIEAKGAAYRTGDGLYFEISRFPAYGRLSGNTLENLKAGARVEINPEKKHPADFALWKFGSPTGGQKRQMEWNSPWGKGFPGWHIECSAMSMKYLGETFDLHTGGEDNKFPHHECEIAQSETATGKTFVNYWMHTKFLMVNGEKMSKSLNNFFKISDIIEKGLNPLALRYLFLTAHYRTNLNFTWESLQGAQNALNNLRKAVAEYDEPKNTRGCVQFEKEFLDAINDDLDLPKTMAIVWAVIKSHYPSAAKKKTLLKFDRVLGLNLDRIKKEIIEIPEEIKKLAADREQARQEKNWKKSDELRKKIENAGFSVEDTAKGPKIKKGEKNTLSPLKKKGGRI